MKKVVIVILGGLSLALIIGIFLTQKSKTPISPDSKSQPSPTKTASSSVQLKTYNNPSGFSFKYPGSFFLTEKKISDQSIYAWVELTDPQKKGTISIKLESSGLAKIDDWFTSLKKNSLKGEVKKIKLADIEGREFTDGSQSTTIALDQGGVLISIITTDMSSSVHQQIVSSFVFTQPTQAAGGAAGDGSGDVVFEGEEVIQ